MKLSRKNVIGIVVLVVLLGAGGAAAKYFTSDAYKYRGLVTTDDTGLTEEQRQYYLTQIGTSQSALEAQKKTMDINDVDWDLYLSIAYNSAAFGDLVAAREILEEYFTLHQLNPAAYSLYGSVLVRMEDRAGAEEAFRTAVNLQPSEESYRKLISAVRNNPPDDSREDEVKEILEDAVSKIGQTSWLMNELAKWYLAAGDCTAALAHYKVAQDLLPPGNEAIIADIAAAREQCKN